MHCCVRDVACATLIVISISARSGKNFARTSTLHPQQIKSDILKRARLFCTANLEGLFRKFFFFLVIYFFAFISLHLFSNLNWMVNIRSLLQICKKQISQSILHISLGAFLLSFCRCIKLQVKYRERIYFAILIIICTDKKLAWVIRILSTNMSYWKLIFIYSNKKILACFKLALWRMYYVC